MPLKVLLYVPLNVLLKGESVVLSMVEECARGDCGVARQIVVIPVPSLIGVA